MSSTEDGHSPSVVIERMRRNVSQGMATLAELMNAHVEARAEGAHVWDEQGTEYLDCGGYGVFILGHRHPAVVEAVKQQLETQPMSTRVLLNPHLAEAAEALAGVTPEGLDYVFFTNSGAEATELSLKLAKVNGHRRIVSTHGGFHGKTNGALSVTGRPLFRESFEPLLPNVEFIPFGEAGALEQALAGQPPSAVIMEPIQAEGGVVIPPEGFHRDLERICREHGAFLILDEIQTGLGRLGRWWGAEIEGITPDVLLVGKGLSGGVVPVSAVVASEKAYTALNMDPLLHTSTFAGNQLAMSAAKAALATMQTEDVVGRAEVLGERIKELVTSALNEACPDLVAEVRGRGLLIAIEFREDHFAGDFVFELLAHHVLVSTSLNTNRVVRLHPSVALSDSDLDWLADALRKSGAAVQSRFGNTVPAKA
jgi:putrescine aminotransferase